MIPRHPLYENREDKWPSLRSKWGQCLASSAAESDSTCKSIDRRAYLKTCSTSRVKDCRHREMKREHKRRTKKSSNTCKKWLRSTLTTRLNSIRKSSNSIKKKWERPKNSWKTIRSKKAKRKSKRLNPRLSQSRFTTSSRIKRSSKSITTLNFSIWLIPRRQEMKTHPEGESFGATQSSKQLVINDKEIKCILISWKNQI